MRNTGTRKPRSELANAAPQLSDPPVSPERRLAGLYAEHVQFVWRNARRLGCDDSWVDDAVQEVFIVVARRLSDFENRSSIRTWLFAITYRVVLRMRRNRWRYALGLRSMVNTAGSVLSAVPQHRCDADRQLRRLLEKLSDSKRAVFILAELEGMSASEISTCLGLPLGTVHTRLRGARQDLERWVGQIRAQEGNGP